MATMMNPVKSSMFSHIGYDAETLTLLVRFHPSKKQIAAGEPGDLWSYAPFVSERWEEMQAAESVGKWFLANVRGKYEGKKVEAPVWPTVDEILADAENYTQPEPPITDDELLGGEK